MRLSQLDGLNVGIWGAGREGRAALEALALRGGVGMVTVVSDREDDPGLEAARRAGARVRGGPEAWRELTGCAVVIRSPGVSLRSPAVAALAAAGVRLTTGTNLWFAEHEDALTVVVTGTKGKSTTSTMLAHLLREAGEEVQLAGNVGRPLLATLGRGTPETVWVLELSSFQIADLEYAPSAGVLLNLYREHLDWHGDAERYRAEKTRLFRLSPPCTGIMNATDEAVLERFAGREDTMWFGDPAGLHVRDGAVWDGERELYPSGSLPLPGAHNLLNLCGALTALRWRGHDPGGRELRAIEALPHRLQTVAEIDGVRWIDDSISTTPESTMAALRSFPGVPVALIAGGHDRGQSFEELARAVAEHGGVRAVAALGATAPRLLEALRRAGTGGHLVEAADMGAAVQGVSGLPAGGIVLLSPAAPSFGLYRDFEERGRHFESLVSRLAG